MISLWSKTNESLLVEGRREILNNVLSIHDCWGIMISAIVPGTQKGTPMAFKPNYNLQRADRNRAARARSEEKQKKKEEKAAQRKAERAVETDSRPEDETS